MSHAKDLLSKMEAEKFESSLVVGMDFYSKVVIDRPDGNGPERTKFIDFMSKLDMNAEFNSRFKRYGDTLTQIESVKEVKKGDKIFFVKINWNMKKTVVVAEVLSGPIKPSGNSADFKLLVDGDDKETHFISFDGGVDGTSSPIYKIS